MHDQRLSREKAAVAAQDARADERVRVDVGVAQEPVAVADDAARAPLAKPVSGVLAVSTSLLKIQRCPAARRLSSLGLRRSSGNSSPSRVASGACVICRFTRSDIVPAFYPTRTAQPCIVLTPAPIATALADETSPYLLQHAGNPVDWHPWGPEALEQARAEDKPILLSIGYSACHWCHVMAHESFEDEATAAVMNASFVNIKVDREERPDLDRIYQTAHQMLTQRGGGWPLTMFLSPRDHRPFFGGTYFPVEPKYGMPAFRDVLQRVAAYYAQHGAEIASQGDALVQVFGELLPPPAEAGLELSRVPLGQARESLQRDFDGRFGGFGDAPKFPHPMNLEFLLRTWRATADGDHPDLQALYMATLTLTRMAEGGLYDQLGGGFCRYSVDPYWMIPHFEKMLYDNGQLLAVTAQAAVATGDPLFRRVTEETADWMLRDMAHPAGGYYSTLDADSEGHEGRFYVWTPDQVRELVTPGEYAVLSKRFGLDREANFEGLWHLHVFKGHVAGGRGDRAQRRRRRRTRSTPGARSCSPRATAASGRAATRRSSRAGTASQSPASPPPHARSSATTMSNPRRAPLRSCASIAGTRAACLRCTRTVAHASRPTWTTTHSSPGACSSCCRRDGTGRGSPGRSNSPTRCSSTSRTAKPAASSSPPTITSS